jgi:hypothetical protein
MNLKHWAKLTLTLGALLGQDVTTERLLVLEAISSSFETFGRTADRFNLWHFTTPRIR